jgi:hypothetical protein
VPLLAPSSPPDVPLDDPRFPPGPSSFGRVPVFPDEQAAANSAPATATVFQRHEIVLVMKERLLDK